MNDVFFVFQNLCKHLNSIVSGSRQVINSDILRAVTSEDGDEINYSLVRPPRLGRLIKPNQSGQFEEISQFTQTEVTLSLSLCFSMFKISDARDSVC